MTKLAPGAEMALAPCPVVLDAQAVIRIARLSKYVARKGREASTESHGLGYVHLRDGYAVASDGEVIARAPIPEGLPRLAIAVSDLNIIARLRRDWTVDRQGSRSVFRSGGIVLRPQCPEGDFSPLLGEFPTPEEASEFVLTQKEAQSVFNHTAKDPYRALLMNARLEGGNLIATDTHRLTVQRVAEDEGATPAHIPQSCILPGRYLVGAERGTVMLDGLSLSFKSSVAGTFPNWRRVIPDTEAIATFDPALLRAAAVRSMPFCRWNAMRLRLRAEVGGLTLSARTEEGPEYDETLAGEWGDWHGALNARFLAEALAAIEGEVSIRIPSEYARGGLTLTRPMVFEAPGVRQVIMPMAYGGAS